MTSDTLELFPPPSTTSVLPGVSPDSTKEVIDVLKDNHKRWDIFFNESRFHNHIAHHALAIWAMGAPKSVIRAAYERDSKVQRDMPSSNVKITEVNFNEHLGNMKMFSPYIAFFSKVIQEKGVVATLEEYVFSPQANFNSGSAQNPEMLNRFTAGLLHPLIHTGYGVEFDIPGLVVEGLAQTAVHLPESSAVVPPSLWQSGFTLVKKVENQLQSALTLDGTTTAEPAETQVHAFTILARILQDSRFDAGRPASSAPMFAQMLEQRGATINNYVEQWTLNLSDPKELERKIEELHYTNALLYAVSGWKSSQPFTADFFLMHLVTSSHFLKPLAYKLSTTSQALLLRSYFALSLTWWIAKGRPGLNIESFFAAEPVNPFPSGNLLELPYMTLVDNSEVTANPWGPLIQMAILQPDDHLCKIQRTLAQHGRDYGSRVAGQPDFVATELKGSDKIDGTLFIRAAALTAARFIEKGKEDRGTSFLWGGMATQSSSD